MSARRSRTGHSAEQPDSNRLLASLTGADAERLAPHLTAVSLTSGQLLFGADQPIEHVYFPDSAALSMVTVMGDGSAAEVGTVGKEGLAGLAVLFGVASSPTECFTQVAGEARRIPVAAFKRALRESASLRASLLRYAHTYLHQVAQTAACNALHPLADRCARWLLLTDDATGDGADGVAGAGAAGFLLTQEYLAYMLGVRREGVSAVARQLRDAGLIRFSRGRVTVTDRTGLELAACECYAAVRAEYARVVG